MLPHLFGRNEAIPLGLIGATILQVGTYEDSNLVETGGLVIDYRPAGTSEARRVVFAFNDVAMWVAGECDAHES